MTDADLVPAEPSPWATYQRRRAEGALAYQSCDDCRRSVFPPRVLCPHCGSVRLQWNDSELQGTVYSQTHVTGRESVYQVLLVDLDEGIRVMASASDDAEEYPIGARVRGALEIDTDRPDAEPRLVFAKETC